MFREHLGSLLLGTQKKGWRGMTKYDHVTPRHGAWAVVSALCASLCLAVATPAHAGKVGVAAAVNPDAFSSLSGVPNKQLNIGKSIFYNERIKTTTSGLVQVLLVDGSTFTVGPNSNLVIDKFVYDPKKKTGELVATFSKGSMRFIGGKLSKNAGGVKVNTPSGALAIRGGMFQGNTQKKIYSFLYGHSLTFRGRNGQTQTIFQPGYTLDLSRGGANVRPTTPEDTNVFMQALSSPATNTASTNSGNNGGEQQAGGGSETGGLTQTVSLQNLISDATSDATATEIDEQLAKQEQQAKNDPPVDPVVEDPPVDPEPLVVELRVLTPPDNYTAYGNRVPDPESAGILGGDDDPNVTADDFIWTFTIEDGRVVGNITGLVGTAEDGEGTVKLSPVGVNFPAVLDCLEIGICPVTDATISKDGVTKTYQGLAVLRNDFYVYDLVKTEEVDEGLPQTVLAFGGKGYDFGTPSGRTFTFLLTPDIQSESFAPFSNGGTAPVVEDDLNTPQPFVTPLLFKEKTDGTPESEAVWLQTSLYIKTTPRDDEAETEFDQQSFVNIALGGIDAETGGLVGARRGGSQVGGYDYQEEPQFPSCNDGVCNEPLSEKKSVVVVVRQPGEYSFSGDIASLADPDGSHFLGKDDPNLVLGFDSTGEVHNIAQDTSYDAADEFVGSTYHVAVGIGTLPPQSQSFDGTFDGYAAGMVESEIPAAGFTNSAASKDAGDFQIGFDKDANTLWADITVFDTATDVVDSYQLKLGDRGAEPQNRSAYVDDLHYAAIESGSGDAVTPFETASAASYLVSGDQLGVTQFFPETFDPQGVNADGSTYRPFCNDCDFIKWGAWGARVAFDNGDGTTGYVDNVHLGWWVAGDITPLVSLEALAAAGAEATYAGNAIGNVASRINSEAWSTYVAAGKLNMNWNFAERAGDFEIGKFDKANFPSSGGLTFRGDLSRPGEIQSHFAGNISGSLPNSAGNLSGVARGSFVNDRQGNLARGVIGNWNVGGNNYKATGIFAGSGRPPVPGPVPQ